MTDTTSCRTVDIAGSERHCKNKVVKITNLFLRLSTVATLKNCFLFHSIRLVCYIQCRMSISITVWIMCAPYSIELCYMMWQKFSITSCFDSDTVTVKQYEWFLVLQLNIEFSCFDSDTYYQAVWITSSFASCSWLHKYYLCLMFVVYDYKNETHITN